MDMWELLTTPIDELYDMGIIAEPEPERNKKMCTLTFKCCVCGDLYTERYQRNNPDKVSRGMYCIECHTPTMFLENAVPFTLHYKSRAMELGSFSDDVSTACWYCGSTDELHRVTFSNGQEVKTCPTHFRPFVKEAFKALQRKITLLANKV